MSITNRTLKMLAALFWIGGAIALLVKGGSLLLEAATLKPGSYGLWTAAIIALLIGAIKARFLFSGSCRKNIARIAALNKPRAWEFFRPFFWLFLLSMILAGAILSNLAHGSYYFLLCMATLDLTIAIALLGSCYVFWSENPSSN